MTHVNLVQQTLGNPGSQADVGNNPVDRGDLLAATGALEAQLQNLPDALQHRKITSADIVNLTADKIIAGTITSDILISGSISTAADLGGAGGAGVKLSASGVELFNSSNVRTVFLDAADGSASFSGNLVAGNITGSWLPTSGVIATSTSGARVEIKSTGVNVYTESGGGAADTVDAVKFWRDGEADSLPDSGLFSFWDSTHDKLSFSVIKKGDSTHYGEFNFDVVNAADDTTLGLISLRVPPDDGSTRDYLLSILGTKNGFAMQTTDGITGSNEMNFSGVGWCKTYLSGSVRLTGPGLIYDNAQVLSFTGLAAGATDSQTITYGSGFSTNLAVPDVVCVIQDLSANGDVTCYASSRTRSGCHVNVRNNGGSSIDIGVIVIPLVT